MQIILLDTETTDLGDDARLVQLAYKNLATGDELNEYFNSPRPISYQAMASHHITQEMIADKLVFERSKQQADLIKLLADNILVAHNALFDIKILKNEGVKTNQYIDTLRVARHLIESEDYKMQYLRYFLKLKAEGQAHDAMGDVIVLEALFEHLKNVAKEKFSFKTDEEIFQKMLELTQAPALLKTFQFGKYLGKTFEEVCEIDRGYLEWLYNSESKKEAAVQNEELVYTLKTFLE
jgi:DNA polymerase III epsilon subunit-like protein